MPVPTRAYARTPRRAQAPAGRPRTRTKLAPASSSNAWITWAIVLTGFLVLIAAVTVASRNNENELPPRTQAEVRPAEPVKAQPSTQNVQAKVPANTTPSAAEPQKPAARPPILAEYKTAPATTPKAPSEASSATAEPSKEAVKKAPQEPRKPVPKPLFPSICCSNLSEYIPGAEGQFAKAESVWAVTSTKAEPKGKEWDLTFRVRKTIKGEVQPSHRTILLSCDDPKLDYGLDPAAPAGKDFVVYFTKENQFFVLTAEDFSKTDGK